MITASLLNDITLRAGNGFAGRLLDTGLSVRGEASRAAWLSANLVELQR